MAKVVPFLNPSGDFILEHFEKLGLMLRNEVRELGYLRIARAIFQDGPLGDGVAQVTGFIM